MSKGLRQAAFPWDAARARPVEAELPLEIRSAWGAYLLEDAPEGLRVTVEAPTLARLFVDAARAMGEQLGEPSLGRARAPGEARQLSVIAANADQLMAAWLGELLHCARQSRRWFSAIAVSRISPAHLRAELGADQEMRWLVDPTSIAIVESRVATLAHPIARRFVARIRFTKTFAAAR